MSRETRLFLGNTGTGKSTIINCLVGNMVFQSGSMWGGSLTRGLQCFEEDGVTYMDTPGLSDVFIIASAARAITTALKQAGIFKLFFMVRLENGKVVPEDLSTMESILDSIKLAIDFSVVINNISENVYNTLSARGREYDAVMSLINCGKYTTTSICLIPNLNGLVNAPNKVVTLPQQVLSFFETKAPSCVIKDNKVKTICLDNFERQTLRIRDKLEVVYWEYSAALDRIHERGDQQVRIDVSELPQYPVAREVELDHLSIAPATPYVGQTYQPTAPPAPTSSYTGQTRQPPVSATHYVVMPRPPATPTAPYHAQQSETSQDDCEECLVFTSCCLLLGPLGICCYFLFFKDKNKS